jgi:hypothetical protein
MNRTRTNIQKVTSGKLLTILIDILSINPHFVNNNVCIIYKYGILWQGFAVTGIVSKLADGFNV